jgi:hypothetical protein
MSKPRKKPTRARKAPAKPIEADEPVETLQQFKRRMLEENRIAANARFDADRARAIKTGVRP